MAEQEPLTIRINCLHRYDGEYPLETERAFNTREWHWIKKLSGYMPVTIVEGFEGGDPSLFLALAVIAMCRAGKIDPKEAFKAADEIAEAPFDGTSIELVGGDAEVEEETAVPPAGESASDESSRSTETLSNKSISGLASPNDSERSDKIPFATGTPESAMSAPQLDLTRRAS